ncbi:hypothetical protein BDR26DRAFT_857843 [Obelidium mucronatum]|nr:hypothetical protein BDR26DRAFT_857843 [Obelidium mucronatum]
MTSGSKFIRLPPSLAAASSFAGVSGGAAASPRCLGTHTSCGSGCSSGFCRSAPPSPPAALLCSAKTLLSGTPSNLLPPLRFRRFAHRRPPATRRTTTTPATMPPSAPALSPAAPGSLLVEALLSLVGVALVAVVVVVVDLAAVVAGRGFVATYAQADLCEFTAVL